MSGEERKEFPYPVREGGAGWGLTSRHSALTGFYTLYRKEWLRFWKVSVQTILAPVLTALLFLVVFAYSLRGHAEVFAGFLKGTRIAMTIEKLRLVRPDVAVADVDMTYSDFQNLPRGVVPMPDGLVHSSLLMVLVKHGGEWWVSAYHNIWRVAAG